MRYLNVEISAPGYENTGKLSLYLLDNSPEMKPLQKRPLILICPGGGYHLTSDREAEPLAMRFLAMGYHAAVLRYSVWPVLYPVGLLQLAGAVRYLRDHAEEFFIAADQIFVQGSSAGGHLAASLGVFWNREFLAKAWETESERLRPDGLLLSYPVITSGRWGHEGSFRNLLGDSYEALKEEMSLEHQVSEQTPPTFLWHTTPDDTVPPQNSLLFYEALLAHGVPAELHIYAVGGHGLALANEETRDSYEYGVQEECQSWIGLAETWLKSRCGK